MPTKRRSTYVQSPIATRTPPGRTGRRTVLQIGLQPGGSRAGLFILCSFFLRLLIRFWRWDGCVQTVIGGRSSASCQSKPAEPRLLDQPHCPGLLHLLLGLFHPVPRRGQATASEPASTSASTSTSASAAVQTAVPASVSASLPATVPTSVPAAGAAPHCSCDEYAGSESHWWGVIVIRSVRFVQNGRIITGIPAYAGPLFSIRSLTVYIN